MSLVYCRPKVTWAVIRQCMAPCKTVLNICFRPWVSEPLLTWAWIYFAWESCSLPSILSPWFVNWSSSGVYLTLQQWSSWPSQFACGRSSLGPLARSIQLPSFPHGWVCPTLHQAGLTVNKEKHHFYPSGALSPRMEEALSLEKYPGSYKGPHYMGFTADC